MNPSQIRREILPKKLSPRLTITPRRAYKVDERFGRFESRRFAEVVLNTIAEERAMRTVDVVAAVLVVVGAVNWGLVGAAHLDLVALLFGAGSILSSIVYVVVGVA